MKEKFPCQQLMGGTGSAIYENENGLCDHPECDPNNDDRGIMKAPADSREVKCYLCDKKLFSIRHAYEKFFALCEKCLLGLEKQEVDQVQRLNRELGKMKDSKHFIHTSEGSNGRS